MESRFLEIINHLIHVYGGSPNCQPLDSGLNSIFFQQLDQISEMVFNKQQLTSFIKKDTNQKDIYSLKKLKYYLQNVFGEVVDNFYSFKEIQEKVQQSTLSDKMSIIKHNENITTPNDIRQVDLRKIEQKLYMTKRLDEMTQQQFEQFTNLRKNNFLILREKEFQNVFKLTEMFKKIKLQKRQEMNNLVNYIFCKFIESVIH